MLSLGFLPKQQTVHLEMCHTYEVDTRIWESKRGVR